MTSDVYEKTIKELGLRLAQGEVDRAFLVARLGTGVEALAGIVREAEQDGKIMDPEMRARLQTLVVTLTG